VVGMCPTDFPSPCGTFGNRPFKGTADPPRPSVFSCLFLASRSWGGACKSEGRPFTPGICKAERTFTTGRNPTCYNKSPERTELCGLGSVYKFLFVFVSGSFPLGLARCGRHPCVSGITLPPEMLKNYFFPLLLTWPAGEGVKEKDIGGAGDGVRCGGGSRRRCCSFFWVSFLYLQNICIYLSIFSSYLRVKLQPAIATY
jgi:hypothetical protein